MAGGHRRPARSGHPGISNRIRTYHAQTEPLIEYYKSAGKYHECNVDGGTIEINRAKVLDLMETFA